MPFAIDSSTRFTTKAPVRKMLASECFGWPSVREGVDSDQGWPLYLARYAALLETS